MLLNRFDERLKSALANPEKKISNVSKSRFKKGFDLFNAEKNSKVVTFHTDKDSVEEISDYIIRFLS